MMRKVFTAMALTALAALPVRADVYSIDKGHSEVSFQVRHLLSNVRGRFKDFAGNVNLDPANLEKSSVDFHIKTASIDTDEPNRDKHLQSPDFFDATKNPEITFQSKGIKKTGKDTYDVTGDFTMHGVTKQITLPVTFLGTAKDPWGNQRAAFSTDLTIDRKDYNINWNKALDNGGALLGDDVKISINLETVQQKDKPKDAKGK
jgi:polyisoprenoid-binding protein YceI